MAKTVPEYVTKLISMKTSCILGSYKTDHNTGEKTGGKAGGCGNDGWKISRKFWVRGLPNYYGIQPMQDNVSWHLKLGGFRIASRGHAFAWNR